MNLETTWVGIDVSKANLDVQLLPQDNALQVDNSESAIMSLGLAEKGTKELVGQINEAKIFLQRQYGDRRSQLLSSPHSPVKSYGNPDTR